MLSAKTYLIGCAGEAASRVVAAGKIAAHGRASRKMLRALT
jgi:hypothetical protein